MQSVKAILLVVDVVAIASRFIWQHKLFRDVREDIGVIMESLMVMQEKLLSGADAEQPGEKDKLHPTKAVLRELCYEIENKADDWALVCFHGTYYKDGIKKRIRKFSEAFPDKIHYQIAKDIKGIKRQLKEIIDGYETHRTEACSSSRSIKVDPRLCMIHKDATELVGVDGPINDLVNWLIKREGESAHQQKVVSIVGCAGLGKTTIAKQVYEKFGINFEYRAFVSVSQCPDINKILNCISCQLHNRYYSCDEIEDSEYSCDENQDSELIYQIREFLQDKRYFIIIDDIWDIDTWKILDSALYKNSHGCVIMTTTRMYNVAKECCLSNGNLVYKMQPLSVADSKKLFFKGIFGCEECLSDFEKVSDDILKKCEGLPLAINAISSLLSTGKTKEEWYQVRSSICCAQGKNSDIDAMNYILSLSYLDLPHHLRYFLLYLTMFPEDYRIEMGHLVHSWISEGLLAHRWINGGLIRGEHREDLVELVKTYLLELTNRSLIESVGMQYDGKARFYRVHRVILDFLMSRSAEENFCTLPSNPSKPDRRVHRLSLFGNENPSCVAQLDLSHARSLRVFGHSGQLSSFAKSNALLVLDLQDCLELGNHHVKDIERHPLLRYLNISGTDITELPLQIGDLEFLETLDASFTELVEMPGSITRLSRLQRLFVSDETKLPDEIGNMYSLQELGDINAFNQSVNFLNELGKLMRLRELGIIWDTNGILKSGKGSYKEKKLVSSLCKLDHMGLRTLCVTFYLREKDGFIGHPFLPALNSTREVYLRRGRMCWINKWLLSLANLEKLYISGGDEIEQDDLHTVGSIPTLVEFKLYSGCLGPIIISSGFQQLERLELKFSFSQLVFEVGAMPNLKKLDLHVYLSKFKSAGAGFDFGIQHLTNLAWVSIVIFCEGVSAAYVEAAEAAFKSMVNAHPNPNRPILEMTRESADFMSQDE